MCVHPLLDPMDIKDPDEEEDRDASWGGLGFLEGVPPMRSGLGEIQISCAREGYFFF